MEPKTGTLHIVKPDPSDPERLLIGHPGEALKDYTSIFANQLKAETKGLKRIPTPTASDNPSNPGPTGLAMGPTQIQRSFPMPSTAETVGDVRRRLGKELYRFELDLLAGGRVAGKSCDCLQKHTMGVEAISEELIPMDQQPIYPRILAWLNEHQVEFRPEEIERRTPEHYQALSSQVRTFRKEVLGTEKMGAMLTPDEKAQVAQRLQEAQEKLKKELE